MADPKIAAFELERYKDLEVRGIVAAGLLVIALLTICIAIFFQAEAIYLTQRELEGQAINIQDWMTNNEYQTDAMQVLLAGFVLAAIGFLSWLHHAAANLSALRLSTEYPPQTTPALAVIWWFVPVANLVKPYQVMREIARRSSVAKQVYWLIPLWWSGYLVAGMLLMTGEIIGANTIGDLIMKRYLTIAAYVLHLFAGTILVVLVWKITYAQEKKRASLAEPTRTEAN